MLGFARIGDRVVTAKGIGIIMRGSQNTLIERFPAARVGDMVLLPRGVGIIIQGSSTVKINNLQAARMLDRTMPPGIIITSASRTLTK